MIYNNLITQYQMNEQKLLEYGFIRKDNQYEWNTTLNPELFLKITISSTIQIDVYEIETGEKYIPFYVKDAVGIYVSDIKSKIDAIVNDIKNQCFEQVGIRNQIISYVKEKYGTIPEYPWESSPNAFTLKTNQKKKWYGLVMNVSYHVLGLQGEEKVDVINLKNDPEKIQILIDHKRFLKAYHMNKKYWFTVLLDKETDFEELKMLIDESYKIVE